ncbi:MAG: hypothetical protein HQ559_00655 [Lentisphaerae bacterium]|nr:hypothetical protein [Lentisphaerota bacterium]
MLNENSRSPHLWLTALLLLAAVVAGLSGLYAARIIQGVPEGWYDQISVGITKDGQRAFWYNQETDELHTTDLSDGRSSPPLSIDARQVSWSRSEELLFLIIHDEQYKRSRFAWMTLPDRTMHEGPFASYCAEVPGTGQILLFGDGNYLAANHSPQVQSYQLSTGELGPQKSLFETRLKIGGCAAAEISPNGKVLGASRWGYNDPDETGVWDLEDWRRIVKSEEEASHFFFTPAGSTLFTVRSNAAIVQLHEFDLATGKRTRSSARMDGWCSAADATADISEIAIARGFGQNHIEVFSSESLRQVDAVSFPNERFVIGLSFAGDGASALAIGRTGAVWNWDRRSGEVKEVARIAPKVVETRWPAAAVGFCIYGLLWIPCLLLRRRCTTNALLPSRLFPTACLVVVIIAEALKWFCNFSLPHFIISSENIMLVAVHTVAACSVVAYFVSLLILRIPIRMRVAASATALLAASAWLDASLLWAVAASV